MTKKFIFLSPHLDDAILSCGDIIKKIRNLNFEVEIITIFAGFPENQKFQQAALNFHKQCNYGENPIKYRKIEDHNACNFIGAKYIHLDFLECLYRKDSSDNYIYSDIYNLNNSIEEFRLIESIYEKLISLINKNDIIFAPLGIGNHADHIIINKVANLLYINKICKVFFYEDFPYICTHPNFLNNQSNLNMKSFIIPISPDELESKISAIKFYTSQLSILWKDKTQMLNDLKLVSHQKSENMYGFKLWKK